MNANQLRFGLCCCLSLLIGPAASADETSRGSDRRLGRETQADSGNLAEYRRKWAVIIGINYTERDDARREGVSALTNAEADAQSLADVLIRDYGYADDQIRLLLGKSATKAAIEGAFGKQFLKDTDRVGPEDSVLIFFAGHGNRETVNDQTLAYLCPHDVQTINSKGLDETTCVTIATLLTHLSQCPARHKLFILDSCHSGEIFKFAGRQRSLAGYSLDAELFARPVVQAIAASRGFQTTPDAITRGSATSSQEPHSPFTTALLEALQGGIQTPVFGASALFARIPERVRELNSPANPRGGTLDGDGEFYFFRKSPITVTAAAGIDVTLQTLPGLSGKWWFDEVPWLLPSLRSDSALIDGLPKPVFALRVGGESATLAPAPAGGLFQPRVGDVYELLQQRTRDRVRTWPVARQQAFLKLSDLMSGEVSESERTQMLEAVASLDDPHLLAVVHHRFNLPDSEKCYQAALQYYQQAAVGDPAVRRQGLECLCQADYARFLFDAERFVEAARNYEFARSMSPGSEHCPLFFVHCLIQESAALARSGEWSEADERLRQARRIGEYRLAPDHALLAAIHDQAGWNAMDRWLVSESAQEFRAALELRGRNGADDLPSRLAMYHDRHGLAMADRYRADFNAAREEYRRLAEDLWVEAMRTSARHGRELTAMRLVNTLERLADAYLFAVPSEPAEAQAVYEDAIENCQDLPPHQLYRLRSKLRCKRAAALALAGGADEALSCLQDLAQQDLAQMTPEQQGTLAVYRRVADGIVRHASGDAEQARQMLREEIEAAGRRRKTLARQELELLLFAGHYLLTDESDTPTATDAQQLLNLVPSDLINRTILPYLRPYYDAALAVQLPGARELQLPGLLRLLDQAKTGQTFANYPGQMTRVMFYLRSTDGWAVIRPGTGSGQRPRVIPLAFGRQTLAQAQLPDDLSAVLQQESPTLIHWCDFGAVPALVNADYPFPLKAGHTLSPE